MLARVSFSRKPVGHGAEVLADHHASVALALAARSGRSGRRRGRRDRRRRPACAPSGMTNSRVRPIAWSMRSMPAWRMLAASSARRGRASRRARWRPDRAAAGSSSALGRERIGRRADGDAAHQLAGARPALGAVRRRADREIAVEADFEAAGPRALGGAASWRSASHWQNSGEPTSGARALRPRASAAGSASRKPAGQRRQVSPPRSRRYRLEYGEAPAASRRPPRRSAS